MQLPFLPASWKTLEHAMFHKLALDCKVTGVADAGLALDWEGMAAFISQGQLELGAPYQLDSYVGKTLRCEVLQLYPHRLGIVMGRRNLLLKTKMERQDSALARMHVGETRVGTIKNLADYGAFVDLGGVDGLIPNHLLCWGTCQHPSQRVEPGQHVRVKIQGIDRAKRTVTLSLRDALPDPWLCVQAWDCGQVVQGRVSKSMDYGYFVELRDGVVGLLHINNQSEPLPALCKGDQVQVRLVAIHPQTKRISLALA